LYAAKAEKSTTKSSAQAEFFTFCAIIHL